MVLCLSIFAILFLLHCLKASENIKVMKVGAIVYFSYHEMSHAQCMNGCVVVGHLQDEVNCDRIFLHVYGPIK